MGISSITVNLDVFIIVAIFVIGYFAGIITPPLNFKKKSNPEDKMLQQLPEEDSSNYYAWMWDDSEINIILKDGTKVNKVKGNGTTTNGWRVYFTNIKGGICMISWNYQNGSYIISLSSHSAEKWYDKFSKLPIGIQDWLRVVTSEYKQIKVDTVKNMDSLLMTGF